MSHLHFDRHRRLRSSAALRNLVAETNITVHDLIYPLFIAEGTAIKKEIPSMPGVHQLSLDQLDAEIKAIMDLGIQAVLLFGIPQAKDPLGQGAYDENGIVQKASRAIKQIAPELVVIADTCLCEYTDHGHCGVINDGKIANDASLQLLIETAVSQARAGADIIAPSNMMDGFVIAIRRALDEAGFSHLPLMSYGVKYASAFYGPFRDAAASTPQFGDRKTYQMDIRNRREASKEALTDVKEGADFLIVKPGLAYLDILRDIKEITHLPLVAYNVSGEYAMVKAAAQAGWLDEQAVVLETMTSMKRAGADLIITYFAKDIAAYLKG